MDVKYMLEEYDWFKSVYPLEQKFKKLAQIERITLPRIKRCHL